MSRSAAVVSFALAACGSSHGGDELDAASCSHEPGDPMTIGLLTGIGSKELSGLAASHTTDLLWTHGDSGGTADIYSIGPSDASIHGTLHLQGATAIDWEDIATAPCAAGHCIYVSDTGDNDLVRTSVSLYEVTEPATVPVGSVDVSYNRFDIVYPDGPHNVEALFIDPRDGTSYVITKVTTKQAAVYVMPRVLATTTTAELLTTITIPTTDPRVTAADMVVDECSARIAIRTYAKLYELRGSATATVPELLGSALATLPVADEDQGEAVAYAADGDAYFTTSEGKNPPLHRVLD